LAPEVLILRVET